MAISNTYKLSPTQVSTFGSVNLDGAQSFSVSSVGDETLLSSDGKPCSTGVFYDNLRFTVSVELSQNPKTINVGDTGVLTLRAAERVNGEGVSAVVLTYTSGTAMAVVSSVESTVSHSGNSTATVNFTIVSTDGSTLGLTIA